MTDVVPEYSGQISFVESVCLRPRMYTLDGTFAEVVCFLEGYHSGHLIPGKPDRSPGEHWSSFCNWLRPKFAGDTAVGGWQATFVALRRGCPDDGAALDQLIALYGRYREDETA